ncbi:MAG: AMP-binding protein, partial [Bdellovibrionales bacterium]
MKVIQDWLRFWSVHSAKNTALVDGDSGTSWTYSDLFARAQAGAAYLESQFQIRKGDRIVYLGQNDLSVLTLFFAASRLGAILVPVNYRFSAREVAYVLSNSTPRLFVHDREFQNLAQESLQQVEGLSAKTLALSDFARESTSGAKFPEFRADETDAAMIIYTSGTTGFPKGAMISHQGLFWNSVSTALRLRISQADCAVTFLPLFHT